MKKLLTFLTMLLGIILPREALADTYTLYSGENSYVMSETTEGFDKLYTASVPSLETGFYIVLTATSGTTYFGIYDTEERTVTVGSVFNGLRTGSTLSGLQGFILNGAPVSNATVTLTYNTLQQSYKLKVSQPTVTYTCTLYANGESYSLANDGYDVYTGTQSSLASGFYIVKEANDGTTTTTTYCGTNGSYIGNDIEYDPVTSYTSSNIEDKKIDFTYAPWTYATVFFYPQTNKVKVTGTATLPDEITYKLYGDFNHDGTPELVALTENGSIWGKECLEVNSDNTTFVVYKYGDGVFLDTFGPSANTDILDEQTFPVTNVASGVFSIPAGKYDVEFSPVNGVTCTLLGLHLLSSLQSVSAVSMANKMALEDGRYTIYSEKIDQDFKLYDTRDKTYLRLADKDKVVLAEEMALESTNEENSFDMEYTTYHKVNVYVAADLSTLRLVSTYPKWSLMGAVNDNATNPKYEFDVVETTATEGVKHRLTLPTLSGSFRIQKDNVSYTKEGDNIYNGDVVMLDKYIDGEAVSAFQLVDGANIYNLNEDGAGEYTANIATLEGGFYIREVKKGSVKNYFVKSATDLSNGVDYTMTKTTNEPTASDCITLSQAPWTSVAVTFNPTTAVINVAGSETVSIPSSLTMHYSNMGSNSTKDGDAVGSTYVFRSVKMGPLYGTSNLYFEDGDGNCYGPTSATPTEVSDSFYNSLGSSGKSIGEFAENSNKWQVTKYREYDVIVNFETNEVILYQGGNAPSQSQRRREAAAGGESETDLRLSSGALENVTLEFDSNAGTLTVLKADPAYAIVVSNLVTVGEDDVLQTKTYRLIETEKLGETVYTTSIAKIPAGADLYVIADDGTADKFYGSNAADKALTDCEDLYGATAINSERVFHVGSELENVKFTLGMGDSDPLVPTQLTYVTSDTSYRLVGYYDDWKLEHSYPFTKIGDAYQLYVPELPMCGETTTGTEVGFKIAKVDGEDVTYYGSSPLNSAKVEGADGQTLVLTEGGSNIVLDGMEAHQWFDACLLTLTVSDGAASKRRMAGGVVTLNVKSTITTALDELTADGEPADLFTVTGICVKRNAVADDLRNLAKGVYIYKGKKLIVK